MTEYRASFDVTIRFGNGGDLTAHGFRVDVPSPDVDIDDTGDGQRPAHTLLPAAGIPGVEHLTGLEQLPPTGAWFTAVPLRIEKFGTIPVREIGRAHV